MRQFAPIGGADNTLPCLALAYPGPRREILRAKIPPSQSLIMIPL